MQSQPALRQCQKKKRQTLLDKPSQNLGGGGAFILASDHHHHVCQGARAHARTLIRMHRISCDLLTPLQPSMCLSVGTSMHHLYTTCGYDAGTAWQWPHLQPLLCCKQLAEEEFVVHDPLLTGA